MAFNRPSITTIHARVQADIESRLGSANSGLKLQLIKILAWMVAGVAHGLYGAIDWLANNFLPHNTTSETILGWWAEILKVPRLQPTAATGQVIFTGNNAAVVPAGTLLNLGGVQYSVDADVVIEDGEGTGSVTALDVGTNTNAISGSAISLLAPVAGINSSATVGETGLVGGTDLEGFEAWRGRILVRWQKPPMGGADHDYERWAKEAHPAVTRVWVTAHEGGNRGVVTVRFATDGDAAGDIPAEDSPLLQIVYDHIDSQSPLAGGLDVPAPIPQPVNATFAIKPNTAAVRAAAGAAFNELLKREGRPGEFVPYQGELLGTIPLTHVHEALSLVPGEIDHQIQAISSLAPIAIGHMLVAGEITWAEWQE